MSINLEGTASAKQSSLLRVKLYSNDVRLVEQAVKDLHLAFESSGIKVYGPVPIPTKRKTFTVNRSPHVDKKSREHFEIKVHSRLLCLDNCSSNINDLLSKITLPAGVEIKIKMC